MDSTLIWHRVEIRKLHGIEDPQTVMHVKLSDAVGQNYNLKLAKPVDTHANLTYNNVPVDLNGNAPDYIVETVVVCDKEFGDKFQHNRQEILNYWTVFFWDVNMRFKTLPSSNISFRITSIIVIQNINQQPFVEDSRDANGVAALNQVLGKFAYWIWSHWDILPKFDMAVAALATPISFAAGIAYLGAACNRYIGTVVWGDNGSWRSVPLGVHEIAHNLGAPHDTDANFPGGCFALRS